MPFPLDHLLFFLPILPPLLYLQSAEQPLFFLGTKRGWRARHARLVKALSRAPRSPRVYLYSPKNVFCRPLYIQLPFPIQQDLLYTRHILTELRPNTCRTSLCKTVRHASSVETLDEDYTVSMVNERSEHKAYGFWFLFEKFYKDLSARQFFCTGSTLLPQVEACFRFILLPDRFKTRAYFGSSNNGPKQ